MGFLIIVETDVYWQLWHCLKDWLLLSPKDTLSCWEYLELKRFGQTHLSPGVTLPKICAHHIYLKLTPKNANILKTSMQWSKSPNQT